VCVAFIFAVIFGSRSHHRKAMFYALIAMVVVDVAALVIVTAIN
jgi:predicted membrane protein